MWNWFPALNFQRITAKMNYSPRARLSIDGWPLRRTSAALVSTWLINSELQKSQGEMWNMRRSTSRSEIRPSSSAHIRSGTLWKTQFAWTRETYGHTHLVRLVVNSDTNWGKRNAFIILVPAQVPDEAVPLFVFRPSGTDPVAETRLYERRIFL